MTYSDISNILSSFYTFHIESIEPESIITSLTPGADLIFATTAKSLNIPYDVYLPYSSQEKNWSKELKTHYNKLLKTAQTVNYTSKGKFTPTKIKDNTNHMVGIANKYILVWDGSSGIVKNYISLVMRSKKPFVIYDPNKNQTHDFLNS
jgi:uncharacterized phage-like protein YoqJ